MSRPELTGHAAHFYNTKEVRKYDSSSRMMSIQREITVRAVELLKLSDSSSSSSSYILDVGCGSGLSGQVLEEMGHVWVGCDISPDMLECAKERQVVQDDDDCMKEQDDESDKEEEEEEDEAPPMGDLLQHDMGTGLPFRAGTFDACISISALQWLCYANSKDQNPRQRLARFFTSLYTVLKSGTGRAVLQFYPETPQQACLVTEVATRVGFAGGVVVDYPNSAKAKKHYLVLSMNRSSSTATTTAADMTTPYGVQVMDESSRNSKKKKPIRKKKGVKTKEWILHKKQTQRNRGHKVRPDTKFTARRRPTKF